MCMGHAPADLAPTRLGDREVVYLIGGPTGLPVKIGRTTDLDQRFKYIQAASPVVLSVLWSMRGGSGLERFLHTSLAAFRVHGEWFDFGYLDPIATVAEAAKRFGVSRQQATAKIARRALQQQVSNVVVASPKRHHKRDLTRLRVERWRARQPGLNCDRCPHIGKTRVTSVGVRLCLRYCYPQPYQRTAEDIGPCEWCKRVAVLRTTAAGERVCCACG